MNCMERKVNPDGDSVFNRDDSDTEKKAVKSKSEEDSAHSFSRDKRPRIRRVVEQLNERTPRPRVEREERHPSPYQRDTQPADGERRSYDRRGEENRTYDRDRSPYGSQQTDRRRSYNPNFDEDNRVRRPAPRRYEETSEEDSRFNSYQYDRERPQGSNDYNNRPRYSNDRQPQGNRQGYGRDNYNNNRDNRGYGNRDNRSNNRPYQQRDDRGGNNRPWQPREDRPGNNRPYQQRDDRTGRPGRDDRNRNNYGDRRPQRPDNRPGARKPNDPFKTPKGGYDSEYKPKVYPAYAAANIQEPIRLNKFISMSGLCSRREADEYIRDGQITVNGEVITEMGVKIEPTDHVCFNGETLQGEKRVYILMNKPKGFVTTVEDPNTDRTVMNIVKNACKERVYLVDRLDKNSLGVLLITNDGELTKKLTHPSHEKKKIYQVTLDRPATRQELSKLLDGVELDDGVAIADEVEFLDEGLREVGITIHTGRNRIVRRLFEALGYHVQKLDRVYFAGLTKKSLRRGAWRYLTPKEVAMLKTGSYE